MASSHSSLAPPSPRSPPCQPSASASTSTLESLIPHLLASKRSLASVTHVYRANELCSSTRLALGQSVTTRARTSFLRTSVTSQLDVLAKIEQKTADTGKRGKHEFEAAARDLDVADARLRGTLQRLRETIVEAGLRPAGEEPRSLLDFVDEGGVENLVGAVKETLDEAGEGLREFAEGGKGFREEMDSVKRLLSEGSDNMPGSPNERSPLPDILHEMEDHTRDMARDLESLVSHYDMCVTAVKHTDGGGDAASKIASVIPEGLDIGQAVAGPPQPMDDEERSEMMNVIGEDAGMVELTVTDIRDRTLEMETLHEQVENHSNRLIKDHASTISAFKLLEDISRRLPNYITQSQVFLLRWDTEKSRIDERMEEMESLSQFYDGFFRAYNNLLIEVGRRKTIEQKMESEVLNARARLEKLFEDDAEEREAFRKDQGDFLPVDIWPGLMAAPLRFHIAPVDEEIARVPDISKSVIHRAIRRIHG